MKIDEVFAKKTYRIRAPEQIEKLKRFRKQSDSKPEKAQATQEKKKLRQKHLLFSAAAVHRQQGR